MSKEYKVTITIDYGLYSLEYETSEEYARHINKIIIDDFVYKKVKNV